MPDTQQAIGRDLVTDTAEEIADCWQSLQLWITGKMKCVSVGSVFQAVLNRFIATPTTIAGIMIKSRVPATN